MKLAKIKTNAQNKLLDFTNGRKLPLLLCFGIPVVIMYLIYLMMEIHPFGNGSVLVLDLNAQYVYFYEALRDFVWEDNSLLYSFSRQLGGEFMGIYAYYLACTRSVIRRKTMKVKKNDTVLVITGKDAGKTAKVLAAMPKANKVIVDGINVQKKHKKARSA